MSYSQYISNPRVSSVHSTSTWALQGGPHSNGVIYKIATMTPSNPNSAKSTLANLSLSVNNQSVFANIPGIGEHFLQPYSVVLVSGHGPKDSPGLNYHLVSGVYDFFSEEPYGSSNSRSNFGLNKNNIEG